jgi:hypothetical protein
MVLPYTDARDASDAARHENSTRDQVEVSLTSDAFRKQKVANQHTPHLLITPT